MKNFLSGVLLTINNPFQIGDLVEIAGFTGYIQSRTLRETHLISKKGYHICIPNAAVYKNHIYNFTSRMSPREQLMIEINSSERVSRAEAVIFKALEEHEAVLKDPKAKVLIESFEKRTTRLKVCFCIDRNQNHWLRVKWSLIFRIKRAFREEEIDFPDGGD